MVKRSLVVLVVLAGTASAQPKQKIAILGLEAITSTGAPSKDHVRVAQDLTVALRVQPKAGKGPYVFAPGSERELVDEKLLASCANEEVACMAKIGAGLGTDVLVYGKVDLKKDFYQVSLRMLDVTKKKLVVGWTDAVPFADATGTKLQDFARKGYGRLTDSKTADAAPPPPPTTPATPPAPRPPTPPANCDQSMIEKGDAAYANGQFAFALTSYEAALKCNPTPTLFPKAFAASCRSRSATKAKFYYSKLSAQQQNTYGQICVREGIDPK